MADLHSVSIDLKGIKGSDLQKQIASSKDPVKSKIMQVALEQLGGARASGFDFNLTFGLHGGAAQQINA